MRALQVHRGSPRGEVQGVAAAEGGGQLRVTSFTTQPREGAGGHRERDALIVDLVEGRRGRKEAVDPSLNPTDALVLLKGSILANVQITEGPLKVLDGARLDHVSGHHQRALRAGALEKDAIEADGESGLLPGEPLSFILSRSQVSEGISAPAEGEAESDPQGSPPAEGSRQRRGR